MNNKQSDHESFRSLQLMNELEDGEAISQRELASRLGIAVGLVNSYLKNFVSKGYVRVKNYPRNRYAYLLTPQGFAEKSRLALQHLSYFTGLYTTTRRQYLELFQRIKSEGVSDVVFCGVDEVAEIAYLSLRESEISLMAVGDNNRSGEIFMGQAVVSLREVAEGEALLVVSSIKLRDEIETMLLLLGVAPFRIRTLESLSV